MIRIRCKAIAIIIRLFVGDRVMDASGVIAGESMIDESDPVYQAVDPAAVEPAASVAAADPVLIQWILWSLSH